MGLLDTLYSDCQGFLELRGFKKGSKKQEFFLLGDNQKIKGFIASYRDHDLYFSVATRDGRAGKKENIVSIPAVWVDIDYKSTPEQVAIGNISKFPFKPTALVKSGGGMHVYWKLKEPSENGDIEQVERVLRGLCMVLGGDMSSTDASRILRIPNTRNYKYAPPRPVATVYCNGSEYNLSDFDDVLPSMPEIGDKSAASYSDVNNEKLSRIMGCSFMRHCRDNAAALSESEWYCMITQIMKEPGGVALIHKLSRPYPKYKKSETDDKILHAMNSTGPMTCTEIGRKTEFKCDVMDCPANAPAGLAFSQRENFEESMTVGDSGGQSMTVGDNGVTWGTNGGQMGDSEGDNQGDSEGDNSKNGATQGLASLVESYLKHFSGNFTTRDISEYVQSHFGIDRLSRPHQKALAKILSRHIEHGRLERTLRGGYRIIDSTLEDLDEGLGESDHSVKLPLNLNEMVFIEPKEVILICGNSDGGKTCFALQVGLLNKIHTYKKEECGDGGYGVYHFISEMGGVSFRNKLSQCGPGAYDDYRKHVRVLRFKPGSIVDQIQPNSINIIDYLEPPNGDFREIVPAINGIFDALVSGVAVVCIQMRGEFPVGGAGVFWKPRLAVGLLNDRDRSCKVAKIFKGKNVRGDHGIDGWELDYWVENRGTAFHVLADWEAPSRQKKKYINI